MRRGRFSGGNARRRTRGGVIVVAGPDGAGKSALTAALPGAALGTAPVLHLHHRFAVLPQRGPSNVDVTRPQAQRPYPPWLSWIKSVYLFADYQLGWWLRARRFVAGGGWVILERGWWDLAVDQRRYRIQSSGWLLRALGRLLPRPDMVLVLTAPAQTLYARKPELSHAELERQLRCWRSVLPRGVDRAVIDASRPLTQVLSVAVDAIRGIAPAPQGKH